MCADIMLCCLSCVRFAVSCCAPCAMRRALCYVLCFVQVTPEQITAAVAEAIESKKDQLIEER